MEMKFKEFEETFMSTMNGYVPVYISRYEDTDGNIYHNAITVELVCPWRLEKGHRMYDILNVTYEERLRLKEYVSKICDFLREQMNKNLVTNVIFAVQEWEESPMFEWNGGGWFQKDGTPLPDNYEVASIVEFDKYGHPILAECIEKIK